jgi:hypothetical protein
MSWFGSWLGGGSGSAAPSAPGALTASSLLELARGEHPAFSTSAIPNKLALRHLAKLERELVQAGQERDPAFLIAEEEITVGSSYNAGPHVLPAYDYLLDGDVTLTGGAVVPFTLVGSADRHQRIHRYAGYERNRKLYLIGETADWRGTSVLTLRYAPAVVAPSALASDLTIPPAAENALIAGLAAYMADRCTGLAVQGIDTKKFIGEAASAKQQWLNQLGRVGRVRTKFIREAAL